MNEKRKRHSLLFRERGVYAACNQGIVKRNKIGKPNRHLRSRKPIKILEMQFKHLINCPVPKYFDSELFNTFMKVGQFRKEERDHGYNYKYRKFFDTERKKKRGKEQKRR